jgi:heme A synthase
MMEKVFACAVLFFQSAITFLLAGSVTLHAATGIAPVAQTVALVAGLLGMVAFGLLTLVAMLMAVRGGRERARRYLRDRSSSGRT